MSSKTINLERGMPTVQAALSHLSMELRGAKANRVQVLKLIHGYGSSGAGGAIRQAVHRELTQRKRSGFIKGFIMGEDFTPFNEDARHAVQLCPALSLDHDYAGCNHGITIVVL